MLLSPQRRCNSSPAAPTIEDGSSDGAERRLSAGDVVVVVNIDSFDERGAVVVSGDHDSSTCSPRHLDDCDGRGQKNIVKQRHDDHNVIVKTPPRRRREYVHDVSDVDGGDPDAFKSPPRPPPPSDHDVVRDGPVSPPPPTVIADGFDDGDEDDEGSSFEAGVVAEEVEEHGTPTSVARLMVATPLPPPPSPPSSSSATSESSKTVRILAPPPPPPPLPLPVPPRSFPDALPFEVIGDDNDDEEEEGQAHLNSEPDGECAGRRDWSRTGGRPPKLPPVIVEDDEGQPSSSGPSPASSSSPGSSGDDERSRPPMGVMLRSALKRGAEVRYSTTSAAPSASSSPSSGVNSSTTHGVVTERTGIFLGRRRRGRDVVVDTSWDFDLDKGCETDIMGTTSPKVSRFHGSPPSSAPTTRCLRCTPTTERRVRGLWNPYCHCPFTRLNDDVLMHHVFASYLTTTDMLNVHLVCRRWRYVASQPPCRRRLDLTDYVHVRFDLHSSRAAAADSSSSDVDPVELTSRDVLAHLERHSSDVETFIIKDVGHRLNANVAVEGIGPCLAPLGRLRKLELGGYAPLTDSHVGLILSAPRLLSNSYGGSTVRHRAMGASTGGGGSAGLEVLRLEDCPLLTYKTACHVAANCASTLRELSLRGDRNVTDEGIAPPLADLMRVRRIVTSGDTGDGHHGDAGRNRLHLGSNAGCGRVASSSLPPSSPPSPSSASRVPPRTSSTPSLMDLFSPPPFPPPTPIAPSSPFAVDAGGGGGSGSAASSSSTFVSPSTEDDVDDGSCTVVDSAEDGGGEGCLGSLDISRTRVTADGLLRALELCLSRAATPTSASSKARIYHRSHRRVVQLSEILAGGTGESWTDDRLFRFFRMIDISVVRVLDLRCSDPFGADRRRRRVRGGGVVSTTITDDGLMRCFGPAQRSSSSSSGGRRWGTCRWRSLERIALSGHGPDLTGVGVAAVLRNSPRLSDLDLGGCTCVGRGGGVGGTVGTEESIKAFANALSRRRGPAGEGACGTVGLRRLNLWRCFPGRREEDKRAKKEVVASFRPDGGGDSGDNSAVVPPEERNTSETGRSTTTEESGGSATVSASAVAGGGDVIFALCKGPMCDTLEELDLDDCHFVDGTMVEMLRRRCVRLSDGRGVLRLRGTRYHHREEDRRRERYAASTRDR